MKGTNNEFDIIVLSPVLSEKFLTLAPPYSSLLMTFLQFFFLTISNKLFVGGLSCLVDEKSLKDAAFSSFGDVTE
ncbi:hypothetical protein L195_g049192, partial [Trifolium pratense]